MKVILNQDITGLGEEGDIREVSNGYGRNFLIPKKLASLYNNQTLVLLNQKRNAIEKRKEDKRHEALSLKEKLEAEELTFSMPAGESGKLFGSVNNALIHQELENRGYSIERKRIEVPDHNIRTIGNHTIKIKLYGNEEAELHISVETGETDEIAE